MTKYIVTGGNPLHGIVELSGAKNAGYKALIATLLAQTPSEICDLGLISEIDFAKSVICSLGGTVEGVEIDPHCLIVDPRELKSFEIPKEIGDKSRSTTMYVGPLVHRFKKAVLPQPGGDPISKRPINRHIEGLTALGAEINFQDGCYVVNAPDGLKGTNFTFEKNTHTGTETLLIAAATAKGITILDNAAAEPEVDDLIILLNAMGARITRVAARTIKICGVEKLRGVRHTVMKDRIEAATFAVATLVTKGDVFVKGANALYLNDFLVKVNEVGGRWEKTLDGIRFWWEKPLTATDVETNIYPGFMTDWQPIWSTLVSLADGVSTIHETVFESRFGHIDDLEKMGGKFEFFNPVVNDPARKYNFNLEDDKPEYFHAVKISGQSRLQGCSINVSDIRRGATIMIAGLEASGVTEIVDPNNQIKRGYEKLPERLIALGANIKVEES